MKKNQIKFDNCAHGKNIKRDFQPFSHRQVMHVSNLLLTMAQCDYN